MLWWAGHPHPSRPQGNAPATTPARAQVLTGRAGAPSVDGRRARDEGRAGGEAGIPEGGAVSVGRVYIAQNSLNFQVGANPYQSVGISIEAIDPQSLGTVVENESGLKNLAGIGRAHV